ncbi:hypothetical protein SCHPADRAFT_199010 [Schizopora paradoxa]|uniref:Uncharacterized protein n=1 Tax=Schizopora paradoxa TaxID=27342 RepID=A0A0H2S500_9AGAM|nr:hypothetical protein SCHPADRAFT_199010 [Schizopora paradoxa]
MGVCLAFLALALSTSLLLARSSPSPLSSLPPPSPTRRRRRHWWSFSKTMGSAARFSEDAVAALVSSTSLTTISQSNSLSSRSSYQRSASHSPSRETFSSRTGDGPSFIPRGERVSRLKSNLNGGMLNPRIHHRHGGNNSPETSELNSQVTRNRSPSTSRSPSRRGRRAYPSSTSDTESRTPSASRHRPRNGDPKYPPGTDSGVHDAESKLSTYDTLIALAFVLCVILFFRALVGGGQSEIESGETRWQKHHAFAYSREHLQAKAGVHTREHCHDGQEKSEDGKASGIWHRGGVHADPHGHVSVDPEGHFSYGFHHDHDHENHDSNEQYRTTDVRPSQTFPMTLAWALPRFFRRSEPTKDMDAIETSVHGVDDRLDSREVEQQQQRARETENDDPFANSGSDDVEIHDYAVRVHLPIEEDYEVDKGRTLHRKEHARVKGRGDSRF